ncbi:MAG: aminotransferase class V-fold PLP-dependent enzyme [Alphaproteobacteria bacterium]|nr:aminotransferase class V-fold PLP-dependent enzyme [Alphaproteobacteria bacterium]MDP6566629.1 aminotransferase class V-fold PLP-dependent enzyme [Alphaproteobacteria bacterium]MDP6815362.1 aminotransferase class V-fold PLP-dependent enzyme [Alphaproteobacteria bacterium]
MIPCQRHLFDLPDDVAYLNCAYMSPLMHAVVAAGREAVAVKARPWQITPPDFFETPELARTLFAGLINARADDIAMIPACSYGTATAAANLPLRRGQRLVVLQDQFPSNVYPWRELAKDREAEVTTIPRGGNDGWTPRVLEAIDSNTAIVALPHCHWTDGSLVDLAAVGRRCREVGAGLVVDLTQSIGALPFDVTEIQPDFAVAAGYKWMLGPYTLGFLYVAPQHRDGRPFEHNWIARRGSEDFAGLVDYRTEFQPGARRFDMGEGANFALLPMAVVALRQLLDWGVEEIQATLTAMTADIAERAAPLGLTASDPSLRAGHFLGLRFADGVPEGLLDRLAAQGVYVSMRGDSMRVTPHLYNNRADVDRLLAALGEVMGQAA